MHDRSDPIINLHFQLHPPYGVDLYGRLKSVVCSISFFDVVYPKNDHRKSIVLATMQRHISCGHQKYI